MPGFDKTRFVGLTAAIEAEFSCGICHGILKDPVVVHCCGQTYCFDCVSEWVDTYQTCPNDSRHLTADQLSPTLRMVANFISSLTVRCRFWDSGCSHICPLQDEPSHVRNTCRHNPDRYCLCGALKRLDSTEHSCVQHLANVSRGAAKTISDLTNGLTEIRDQLGKNTESGFNEFTQLKNRIQELEKEEETNRALVKEHANNLKTELVSLKTAQADLAAHFGRTKKDAVPVGFIYVQLAAQDSPEDIWPEYEWKNISNDYSGLFFRVEGGNSEPFGAVQEQQDRSLAIKANKNANNYSWNNTWIDLDDMSVQYIQTGETCGYEPVGIQMKHGRGEVRPRNQAVRVWKRTN